MREIDFSLCKLPPYEHQKRGIERLMRKPRYALFWEMRLGKTKAVLDAASLLYHYGALENLVIVCPAQVKEVWSHPTLGEIKRHCFVPWRHFELNGRTEDWADMVLSSPGKELFLATVSYEFLRQEDAHGDFARAKLLAKVLGSTWTVFDEAAALGNWKSQQTRACIKLGERLKPLRKTLLDGTPIGNSPMEQYAKFKVLGDDILGYKGFHHFRAVHQDKVKDKYYSKAKKDDVEVDKYVGFKNQQRIDLKVREFCEYLEQRDCMDMPEMVPMVLPVRLGERAWENYCDMRDEMMAWLDQGEVFTQFASVKVLRLAQMCSGFCGGVENEHTGQLEVAEISDEASKAVEGWLKVKLLEDPQFKCVVWCRWRPEVERLYNRLERDFGVPVWVSYGGRKTYAGQLHPDHEYSGPGILVAQQQSLKFGTNLSKSPNQVCLSRDYDLVTYRQSIERIKAPVHQTGRRHLLLVKVIVTGPGGERTVSSDVDEALDNKEQVARRTAGEWKRILEAK